MHYISFLSTLVTFVFAAAVLNRYRRKKGAHLLLWAIGLLLYGIGTLTEVWMTFAFNPWIIKLWYLSGAMLTAAWLGQGTIALLVRRRGMAATIAVMLVTVSVISTILVLLAPITPAAAAFNPSQPVSLQYKEILVRSGMITFLTILLNIYGTVTLVGGAVYSSFLFWRKKVLANRMLGNLLIAAGALMPAMAGSFVKAGLVDFLYLSEFIGVVLMYTGFMQATAAPAPQANPAVAVTGD